MALAPPGLPGSKADYVHAVLRQEIMGGELAAGAAVPQDQIAPRLGVSITPVREALRRLESEGLVSYRAHRGATVSELSQEAAELYLLRGAVERAHRPPRRHPDRRPAGTAARAARTDA